MLIPTHAGNTLTVPVHRTQLLLGSDVPQLGTSVTASDGNMLSALLHPAQATDVALSTVLKRHQLVDLAGSGVPEVDRLGESNSQNVRGAPGEQVQVVVVQDIRGVQNPGRSRGDAPAARVLLWWWMCACFVVVLDGVGRVLAVRTKNGERRMRNEARNEE